MKHAQQTQRHLRAIRRIREITGAVGDKFHPGEEGIDWLMFHTYLHAPVAPIRGDEESDDGWNARIAAHNANVKAIMNLIDEVVQHLKVLYPLANGVLNTIGGYAKAVAGSNRTKDVRNSTDTCPLCNCIVGLTDLRRRSAEQTRFVSIHNTCPGARLTQFRQVTRSTKPASTSTAVPLRTSPRQTVPIHARPRS